jgi:mono/diheme cytochrome c family protein
MKLPISRAVVGIAALSLGLTGCGGEHYPAYSPGVKYGLRKDPIVRVAKDLGEERYDPDRPGLLPIMKLDDMLKPDHPYHAKSKAIDDKVLRDPTKVPAEQRKVLEDALEETFGTPAKPKVAGLDEATIADLKLDEKTLAEGSSYYRVHCVHCHGVPGDGRGPTARWINPHPRDFRKGLFKFHSVDQTVTSSRPPARADLLRTLRQGIEGTAMPSFNLLAEKELEALVSYVIHLSLRGKVEATIVEYDFAFDAKKGALELVIGEQGNLVNIKDDVKFYTTKFAGSWLESNKPSSAIKVAPYLFDENAPNYLTTILPASVKRGQEIFNATPSKETKDEFEARLFPKAFEDAKAAALASKFAEEEAKAKAAKTELTDKDKERIKGAIEKEFPKIEQAVKTAIAARVNSTLTGVKCVTCHIDYGRQAKFKFDEWGTLVRPNNLPMGHLRGGKRPVDIYYRIHSGIPGSEMVGFGATFAGHEQYIWDLVNFVSVLPYPTMRDSFKLRID